MISKATGQDADYVRTLTARGEADLSAYSGYLDAMRYGMPPHGGFAFGLERFMARLLDVPNVRQVTLFPRDLHRPRGGSASNVASNGGVV
jgi:nondiscriminating aspartyl-tRNA synthetase